MGHDHQQSSSSGTLVAVIGVGLALAILGIVVVAAVGLFWVRAARMESRAAVIAEQRAVQQLRRARVVALQADAQAKHDQAIVQLEQARTAATPDPRLNFEVKLDRQGNASVDGEEIDLDELRARLAKLKDETSNAFSVQINADPECPVTHVISVMDVCKEVGDVDFNVALPSDSDSPVESNSGN